MADKGKVYYCTWEMNDDGDYVGWEKKHPSVKAEGGTPSEMEGLLFDAVGCFHDDNEPALQFDPPLHSTGNDRWFVDGFVSIAWNAGIRFTACADTAYARGRCKRCGGGLGDRTAIPLIVDYLGAGTDGAFSWPSNSPPPDGNMPAYRMIVSETFLGLLNKKERDTFHTRPVQWSHKRRLKFYEVLPKSFVPLVLIKGLEFGGWRCNACRRKTCGHGKVLGWGVQAVCRSDIPSTSIFFAGDAIHFHLCTSRQRWEQLRSDGARQMMDNPLAVVSRKECVRRPRLPTLDELAAFRCTHRCKVSHKHTRSA